MTIEEARAIIEHPQTASGWEVMHMAAETILDAYTKLQELYEHSEWLRTRGGGYPNL
jgi:hypothetical protein